MAEIKHQKEQKKFALIHNGEEAGHMTYSEEEGRISINHTEVEERLSGQGLGKDLVEAGVKYAREKNYKLIPMCSFARKTIEENADWQDVL